MDTKLSANKVLKILYLETTTLHTTNQCRIKVHGTDSNPDHPPCRTICTITGSVFKPGFSGAWKTADEIHVTLGIFMLAGIIISFKWFKDCHTKLN
jgi:hypothetical protein